MARLAGADAGPASFFVSLILNDVTRGINLRQAGHVWLLVKAVIQLL
jgi:hypothetical protein